jgi:hypothetical protein
VTHLIQIVGRPLGNKLSDHHSAVKVAADIDICLTAAGNPFAFFDIEYPIRTWKKTRFRADVLEQFEPLSTRAATHRTAIDALRRVRTH